MDLARRIQKHVVPFVSLTLLALAGPAFASGGHGHAGPADSGQPQTPAATMKKMVEGNKSFTDHHDHNSFEAYQKGQVPAITVISCADSRVHTPLFGMDPHNNIFIIRNIGNQVVTAEGSVDYGVRHLPSKILLVMGHSSCGAVKASMGDYSAETAGIIKELDSLKPVIEADKSDEPFHTRWGKNVERNVDYQVAQALKLYGDRVESGELAVVGAVYDFNNLYGKGRGTLVITNINGEADPNKLMDHPVMEELSRGDAISHIGSLAPALD